MLLLLVLFLFTGMQEFIEAASFLQYIQKGTLISLDELQAMLTFSETLKVHIPVYEYLLGIADLTGELMRLCINAVGRGQTQLVSNTCSSLQKIHLALFSLKYKKKTIFPILFITFNPQKFCILVWDSSEN